MKKQLTKEEQLIGFLNAKYENSKTNEISISRTDLPSLDISESETIKLLHLIESKDLIKILSISTHTNLNVPCKIYIYPTCIDYFKNKQLSKKEQRRKLFNEIRAWITLIIALAALIHSVCTTDSKNVSSQTSLQDLPESVSLLSDNQVLNP
ncbi:MAG: hypothetical protein NC489_18470 [Ruminococcus flavefaciens]|nr:hypothetical protein [Ruminococcus flavefaciens]